MTKLGESVRYTFALLTRADVEKLSAELGPLSEGQVQLVKAQLCPGATSVGDQLEHVIQYWIENEPSPTRELLDEKLKQALTPVATGAEVSEGEKPGFFMSLFGTVAERGKQMFRTSDVKELIEACGKGEREKVGNLLKNVKPNVIHRRQTPLLAASLMGHLDIVKDLVMAQVDVNFIAEGRADKRPALNAASSHGRFEVAEYLLDQGANVNAEDGGGYTALIEASFNGHPELVQLLIERGAHLEMKTQDGNTALMLASSGGQIETVELLLKYGAITSHRLPKKRTVMHSTASRGQAKVIELLLKAADCHIDHQDSEGATPLIMAVRGFLERATPSARVKARAGLLDTVQVLVSAGANPNLWTKDGETALIVAVKGRRVDEVEVLVESGAHLDIQEEKKGWSAIFFAAEKGYVEIARLLCEGGANLDLQDKKRKSVLNVARIYSPTVHEILVTAKANLDSLKKQASRRQSWYKSDERYPGIRFYGEPLQHTVTSHGAHISWWEEIGVEFDIPPGAVPEGSQLDLRVWPCSSGPFQPPDDYELASPLFLISPSFDFSREITLKMGHFSKLETEEDREGMVFLSAHSTLHSAVEGAREPVYHYQCRVFEGGAFKPHEPYGTVSLKHFCFRGIARRKRKRQPSESSTSKRKRDEDRYVCQMYRDKEYEDVAIFSAFLEHKLYFSGLKERVKEYSEDLLSLCSEQISVVGESISLEWPPPNTGWDVTPDRDPCHLTKDMLDSHEREPYPPMILLKVERNQSSSSHSSSVAVEVVGISERGKKFILKPKQRQGVSPRSLSSSSSSGPLSPTLQSPHTPSTPLSTTLSLTMAPPQNYPHEPLSPQPQSLPTASTEQPNLISLLENVTVTDWYALGLSLGISENDLNFIEADRLPTKVSL